jgi:quercetin dioxygenase-like cupin family protein
MGATVHPPGEGERLGVGGSSVTIKATGEDAEGAFYLGEVLIEPGFPGPPPHVHDKLHDMFYVLEGVLTVRVGEETRELAAGSFVCVPPGVVHTFSNPRSEPVRILNMNTPGGWENYMRDLAAASGAGPPSPAEITKIASKYDFRVAG